MAGQVRVVWDTAAVKLACEKPGGDIDRAMSKLADGVVLSMKYRCPVYSGPPRTGPVPGHPRQSARRSGTLRASIRKMRQPDGSWLVGPTDLVGGQLLGPLVEGGTRPHLITSHGPWRLYNAATGQQYGRRLPDGRWQVHHPGTRPRPFIGPAARDLNGVQIRV